MTSPFTPIIDAVRAADTDTARAIMALSALDWAACGIAGQAEPVSRLTRALIEDEGGTPQASLIGGGRAPMRGAALVNGATSHALDYDDTHFAHIGHPSVAVLPAALAVGERYGKTLPQILDAARLGAEASIRFGLRFGRAHYQAGYHQTATAGAFGACLAAAQLMDLDAEQTLHALGLTATRASGLKSQFGTMGKPFNAGIAAANGVEAAWLAAQGFISNPDALDTTNGFVQTHICDGDTVQPPGALLETLSHKYHACCHGLHATLEALALLPRPDVAEVKSVTITTHPRWLTVCNIPEPRTGLEAKFSYRLVTALALLGHDTAALDTYSDALSNDPQITALRDRVAVKTDDTLKETEALVALDTDGSYEAHFDLEAPMPLATRASRLRAKAGSLVGADRADALWQAIEAGDLSAFSAEIAG
ncbi:MmgE/PrpD family protein [Antarctobacter heliothermus]|uniref:2-methylcitrate dehydratase PrpD n=1 Tax=Antarctobacter heliothermus TaxID=74033 RepID=A0A239AVI4_9RHOB|nr:MmgE/PrpD family protein [Antarctobacter heliothermus]SNR99725.1 2-methylcitrate dehydratase PrpD [Antarctobacter heliothermus]